MHVARKVITVDPKCEKMPASVQLHAMGVKPDSEEANDALGNDETLSKALILTVNQTLESPTRGRMR